MISGAHVIIYSTDAEADRAFIRDGLKLDNVDAEIARLSDMGRACEPISEQRWGRLTRITLPGGGKLAMYQPLHPTAQ